MECSDVPQEIKEQLESRGGNGSFVPVDSFVPVEGDSFVPVDLLYLTLILSSFQLQDQSQKSLRDQGHLGLRDNAAVTSDLSLTLILMMVTIILDLSRTLKSSRS